jgi:polyhydroxyalkanoate synthesis regulator phasin
MSTLFWKLLKLTPALLGASILFAGSAYARENTAENTVTGSSEIRLTSATNLLENQPTVGNVAAPETIVEQPDSDASPAIVSRSLNDSTQLVENPISETSASALQLSEPSANHVNPTDNMVAQQLPEADNSNTNSSEMLEQIQQYQDLTPGSSSDALDQVTNVNQLSDVRPTDWAYEALRSLVERYGCIAGYPDGTFRGNRAMTRYEFAAGVNACLQQIERLIGTTTENFVTKQDLETLQRLVDEFRTELTALGGRVDQLEGRVAFLEDNQFSTTTKLRGEVIFGIADVFGDELAIPSGAIDVDDDLDPTNDGDDDLELNTIAAYRARLNFETSFTGRDRLRTRLEAANFTEFNRDLTGTNMTRLAFDGDNGGNVEIDELWYRFPLGRNLSVQIDATNGEFYDALVSSVNPLFESSGSGAISRFGRFNPIYRAGSGAGITAAYKLGNALELSVGYLAGDANDPNEKFGLFDGNYAAIAQAVFRAGDFASLGLTYLRSYYRGGDVNVTGSTGSDFARRPFGVDTATSTNSYGIEGNVRFGPLSVGGWVGYQDSEAEAGALQGSDAEAWNWAANAALVDFGTKGSMLGVVFGMPPRNRGNDVVTRRDLDTSYHLEAFYRFRVNPNIAITPGVLVIFNPEHNDANDNIYVGTIRTTFTF